MTFGIEYLFPVKIKNVSRVYGKRHCFMSIKIDFTQRFGDLFVQMFRSNEFDNFTDVLETKHKEDH